MIHVGCEGLACVPKNDGTWWCKDVAAALNKTNTTTIGPEANVTANATEIADAARKWFEETFDKDFFPVII